MRFFVLLAVVSVGALAATACGSGAGSSSEPGTEGKVGGGLDPLAGRAAATCAVDADCSRAETCRLVRVGELQEHRCVRDLADDPTTPMPLDAGLKTDATFVIDAAPKTGDAALPPKPTSDSGVNCASALSVTITNRAPPTGICVFNTNVEAESPEWLVYPCAGGAAKATFGTQTFTGTVSSGVVNVTNVDTYDQVVPGTGTTCNYTSTQTITGTLASGTLQYGYTEVLSPGEPVICKFLLRPCSETGPVTVK